jgi:hypothetical protein
MLDRGVAPVHCGLTYEISGEPIDSGSQQSFGLAR